MGQSKNPCQGMLAFTLAIPVSFNATAGEGISKYSHAMHVKRAHNGFLTYLLFHAIARETFRRACKPGDRFG